MHIFFNFLVSIKLAFKAGLFRMAVGVLLVVALAMLLASYFSGRQPATVALDVGISIVKLLVPLLMVLLAQELLAREFDRRYYLGSLSYPGSRCSWLLGRFFALLLIVFFVSFILGGLQVLVASFVGGGYLQSTPLEFGLYYWVSMSFVMLDFLVLTALAVFLSVVSSTPSFVLVGTLGFMFIARSYGAIVDLLARDAGLVGGNAEVYRTGLGVLGYFFPDLGSFDLRMLALYGKPEFLPVDWFWLVVSGLAYALSFLALAVWALQFKRIS